MPSTRRATPPKGLYARRIVVDGRIYDLRQERPTLQSSVTRQSLHARFALPGAVDGRTQA